MNKKLLCLFLILLACSMSIAQSAYNYTCGETFFDSAGPNASYSADADESFVICPQNADEAVKVTFTAFDIEATWDGLYVYNGSTSNAAQFNSGNGEGNVPGGVAGAFWGNAIPGPFTSTSPDGCLTFVFRSDGSVQKTGWEAQISCQPLQITDCLAPSSFAFGQINPTSVMLTWVETGNAALWEILASPCGSPAPSAATPGTVVTASSYLYGSLSAATCYDFYVRSNCGSSVSNWTPAGNATTPAPPTGCGQSFFDNGGATANYLNNSDQTVTVCPDVPGDKVRVTFTAFDIQSFWDGLYIYSGTSANAANQFSSGNLGSSIPGGVAGAFWGTQLPGPFESTAADGCLTFVFKSGESGTASGWAAGITCQPSSNCTAPTNVQVSNITTTSAMISWDSSGIATQWRIAVSPENTPVVTSQNPYLLSGLSPNTNYTFTISGICDGGLTTETQTISFLTATPAINPLTVNTTFYTPEQLVANVLIGNPCLSISNVTSVTGTNFGGPNGIGFFANNNPYFPLSSGIVLSTGNADNIPGPNVSVLSDGNAGWSGDSDLETLVTNSIGQPMNSQNATKLEFDFTALNEFMSFNFLFASDEYGTFQCNYADAFAFLLTDLETGITTNLAVIPGTQTPVSVVTIRDDAFNAGCASANEAYFDAFFTSPDYVSATNLNGQTHLMTASSSLIPNHPYHIKLVIADRNDSAYDSAVFIEAGSFTSGPPQCSDRLELVAFVDENSNGVKDSGEQNFTHGSFGVEQNNSGSVSQVYSPFGTYSVFDDNPANTYDLTYSLQSEFAGYYAASAAYTNVNIAVGSGTQTIYFPIVLTQLYNDVAVSIVPCGAPRPGMTYQNKIVYTNNGISAASGTIAFTNDALVSVSSVSQPGIVNSATGFTYAFSNLLPNETRMFYVTLSVPDPPTVNLDDLLTNSVAISASNDINLANNAFSNTQIVVNSYDPNMIVEAHGQQIDIGNFSVNEYLYYTIYFQNTGTAMAVNVLLEDILDGQLDSETVVMLNASHDYIMERNDNHLTWKFDYIMLPGQLQSEDLSKGFVFFKIKVKPGFGAGDVIPNTASIYFDNNPVVITNTFNTIFVDALHNDDWQANGLVLFPNPANTSFAVNMRGAGDALSSIAVHDVLGKTVRTADANGQNQVSVDVSGLSSGVYLVEINTANGKRLVRKLVVE